MLKLFLLFNWFLLLGNPPQYNVASINEALVENADQVVRNEQIEFEVASSKKMTKNVDRAITYFGKKVKEIPFYFSYSDNFKVKNIELIIFDANGEVIESFNKKDFKDYSATGSSFVTDNRILHLTYQPKQFPITIQQNSITETSTTAFIKSWSPIYDYGVSCEKSNLTISCPKEVGVKFNISNSSNHIIEQFENENTYTFDVKNLPAMKSEVLGPDIDAVFPVVNFAFDNFTLEGYVGTAEDWDLMGQWYYKSLLATQAELSDEAKKTIDQLLNNVENDLDKAKVIYQYVQDRSRYVSIQLGIGGWKPFPAMEVHEKGYSDCKGLTNYTKALMEYAGIEANYAVIEAGEEMRNIKSEFCALQGNHVILCLPDLPKNDTTWLECTSQKSPFGYIGTFTDNRNAWIVSEESGAIVKTKYYAPEENLKLTKAEFTLFEDGRLVGNVTTKYAGLFFRKFLYEEYLNEDELLKHYKNSLNHLPKLSIENYSSTLNKTDIIFQDAFQLKSDNYAQVGADDIIFQINTLTRINELPKRYRNRQLSFEVKRGKKYVDRFEIAIPESYKLSNPIKEIIIDSDFGKYTFTAKYNVNTISCVRELILKDGSFPKEKYKEYHEFYKKIKKADQQKIRVIKK